MKKLILMVCLLAFALSHEAQAGQYVADQNEGNKTATAGTVLATLSEPGHHDPPPLSDTQTSIRSWDWKWVTVNPADDPPTLRILTLKASASIGATEAKVPIPGGASARADALLWAGIEFVPDGFQVLVSSAYTNGDFPYGAEDKKPAVTVELKVTDPRSGSRIEAKAFVDANTSAEVESGEEMETSAKAGSSSVAMTSFELLEP